MRTPLRVLALGAVVGAIVGCGSGSNTAAPTSSPSTTASTATYVPKDVLAGLPVEQSTDDKSYKSLVAMSGRFGHRSDPFALTSEESAYDKQQDSERVFGSIGGFTTQYEAPPEETKEVPAEEQQPYRRLAGIIVGDSVLALIDMGTGSADTIIRPGMKVPNTEWTVMSINEDEAILHRDGPVGPHTIAVRLETPPAGIGGGGMGYTGGGPMGGPPGMPGGRFGSGKGPQGMN